MTWKRNKTTNKFHKTEFKESSRPLYNPGCGWYHVYPFLLPVSGAISLENAKGCLETTDREEQLALLQIHIGAFRACELSKSALESISRIFDLFCMYNKQMIVRFVYDMEGKGMEHEPQSIALIKRHMEQAGGIICRYAREILVLQGIFVGSWGEMHGSKFLSVPNMSELICSLYEAVRGSCYLAVRTPKQWRGIIEYEKTDPALKNCLGLFNDGMFASSSDLGTYESLSRQEELAWQEHFVASVPNGGETVAGNPPVGYRKASEDMRKMHLSYLNSTYHPEQLNYWKKEQVSQSGCWNGATGFEYIGRHLGYRFFIRDVKIGREKPAELFIENCGFSGLFEEADCFLLIENASGKITQIHADTDVRRWESAKRMTLQVQLPLSETERGERKLFFLMKRKRDGRIIRFANQDAEDKVFLGTLS